MIKLKKGPVPAVLAANGAQWAKDFLECIEAGNVPPDHLSSRYRHPEIKRSLVDETSGKCAYCESKVLHVHHGDVEHITPKSLDPARRYEWENLTLACEVCNQLKGDLDPIVNSIIDPYLVDPTLHLHFLGPFIFHLGTVLGIGTESVLKLNRARLIERRKEAMDACLASVQMILREDIPLAVRRALYSDLIARCGTDAQFSAMLVAILSATKEKLPADMRAVA